MRNVFESEAVVDRGFSVLSTVIAFANPNKANGHVLRTYVGPEATKKTSALTICQFGLETPFRFIQAIRCIT